MSKSPPNKINIIGICVENEPNVFFNKNSITFPSGTHSETYTDWVYYWDHWWLHKKKVIKSHIVTDWTYYSSLNLVYDELEFIKYKINHDPALSILTNAKTVVNMHCVGEHWQNKAYKFIRDSPNLDRLGIDLYTTHGQTYKELHNDIDEMKAFSKPWWCVETEGAAGPYSKSVGNGYPKTTDITAISQQMSDHEAEVVGYYRLWGNYDGLNHDSAYNIWTNPGLNPTPTKDKNDHLYWEAIRDI